ncbi:MAG: hypothetical protein EA397_15865 [Deltaproteobacteria bacterium]|nr:MAG: hypothetical protein EA397_15865 [Deltaproteobacteria bacterium]
MTPPFVPNPDAYRCLQCTLLMALRALGARHVDGRIPDLDLLDTLTHRRPGEGTWTHAAYLALRGFPTVQARAYDAFDYRAFAQSPTATLFDAFPRGIASAMASGFDLVAAASLARELLDDPPLDLIAEPPTLRHVDALLTAGWLLLANVDAGTLSGRGLTSGHSVLLFAREGEVYRVHDPGMKGEGRADLRISRELFEAAWSFMGPARRELLALKAVSLAP